MDENQNQNNDSISETFDTWTLVSQNPALQNNPNINNNNNNIIETKRIEILNKDEDLKAPEVNIEELSDGISVISETESIEEYNERFSPMNETLFTAIESQIEEPKAFLAKNKIPQNKIILADKDESRKQVSTEFRNYLTVKNLVSGVFYIGMFAGILGFIGQLKGIHDETSLLEFASLKDRVDHLELNNNLLRAEIDILQKKITYLTNQHQSNLNQFNKHQKNQDNRSQEGSKSTKNENYLNDEKPDITSACEDDKKYINGLCVTIEDKQYSKYDKRVNEQKSFEETNKSNILNKVNQNYSNSKTNSYQSENKYPKYKHENNEKYQNYKTASTADENVKYFSGESDEDDNDYNKKPFKSTNYKKSNKYDNKKDDRYNSKENKYDKSKEYINKKSNGHDWHGKLMDSREEYRKQKSKDNDNWYVERGHSRENFRIFEEDNYKKEKGH